MGNAKYPENLFVDPLALGDQGGIRLGDLGIALHQPLDEVAVGNTAQEVINLGDDLRA